MAAFFPIFLIRLRFVAAFYTLPDCGTHLDFSLTFFVYSADSSKAVDPVIVLHFVALWIILRGDLF